ncbi:C39 family peptidase [bacterium]|nr:C39 family peptidase [bacterium]
MNKFRAIVLLLALVLMLSAVSAYADVILGVPFLYQFWNGGACGSTSCGPASLTMCCRYIFGQCGALGTPSPQDMINIWSYLGGSLDGNDAGGTSLGQLTSAAHSVFSIGNAYQTTSSLASVKSEIAAGKPVLVHVYAGYLSNRGYSYTGGHYIAAVGYNDNYLICNDPGTYLGEHKYYSNADMINAMNAVGCGVIKGFYNPVQPPPATPNPGVGPHIQYVGYVQDIGWQNWTMDGGLAGTANQSKRLEGICMTSPNTSVYYSSYVGNYGWQDWKYDGELSGTTGLGQKIEAIRLTVGEGYSVYYQAYVQDYGWLGVVSNGTVAGTTGQNKRMEAFQAWIIDLSNLPDSAPDPGAGTHIQYVAHVQNYGWQDWVQDGSTAGTVGLSKAIEAVCMSSPNTTVNYSVYVGEGFGWQGWVSDGALSGTTGINKPVQAIVITVGEGYSVSYQAHVQDYGWMSVYSDGGVAGIAGKRLEALRVWITPT